MRAVRPVALIAIATALIAASLQYAIAGEGSEDILSGFVLAQTSMGAPEPSIQQPPARTTPKLDYIPPSLAPSQPAPSQPAPSSTTYWGALGFTADGSYSTIWKLSTQGEAEAEVAKRCAKFGRGACEVVSFSGQRCAALATFIGRYSRRRWNLSYSAGGETYPEAQSNAMQRCNSDERAQNRCQLRTAACADGR